MPLDRQCSPGNRLQSIATHINQALTQALNWNSSCINARVSEFGMKNRCRNWLALFVFVSLASIAAVCQTAPRLRIQMNSTSNCQNIGPTVSPASGPSSWLPKITGRDQLPKTPTSCSTPEAPSVQASNVTGVPSTNDPPKPQVNNTPPSSATVSETARTLSMRPQ